MFRPREHPLRSESSTASVCPREKPANPAAPRVDATSSNDKKRRNLLALLGAAACGAGRVVAGRTIPMSMSR
jgi:hypothetical protein